MTDENLPVKAQETLPEPGATSTRDTLSFDPHMLEALVCPHSQSALRYDAEAQELISKAANVAYPIRDGIPVMLYDEARNLDDDGKA